MIAKSFLSSVEHVKATLVGQKFRPPRQRVVRVDDFSRSGAG
jgi:hypothetical protein